MAELLLQQWHADFGLTLAWWRRRRRLMFVDISDVTAATVAAAVAAAAANATAYMSDVNRGGGGNEAEDGGSSSSNTASSTAVPAEHDGSQSSMASRRWAVAAMAFLTMAIISLGQWTATKRANSICIGAVALSTRHSTPAKAKPVATLTASWSSSITEAAHTEARGSKELLDEQFGPQRRGIPSTLEVSRARRDAVARLALKILANDYFWPDKVVTWLCVTSHPWNSLNVSMSSQTRDYNHCVYEISAWKTFGKVRLHL